MGQVASLTNQLQDEEFLANLAVTVSELPVKSRSNLQKALKRGQELSKVNKPPRKPRAKGKSSTARVVDLDAIKQTCKEWISNPNDFFSPTRTQPLIAGRLSNLFRHVDHLDISNIKNCCRSRIYMIFYFRLSKLVTVKDHFELCQQDDTQFQSDWTFDMFREQMQTWISQGGKLDALCRALGSYGAVAFFPPLDFCRLGTTGKHHEDTVNRLKSSGIVEEAHELNLEELIFLLESIFFTRRLPQTLPGENILHVGIYPRTQDVVEMAQDDVSTSERAFNSREFSKPSDAAAQQYAEIAQTSTSNTLAPTTLAPTTLAPILPQASANGICNPESRQVFNNPAFSALYDTTAMRYSGTANEFSTAYVTHLDAEEDTPGSRQRFNALYDTAAIWYSGTANGFSTAYTLDARADTL